MKTILVNYLGRNNSAPYFSYSIGKALSENGYDVIAVVSKHATNIDDWRNYGFRRVYEVDTYTSKRNVISKSLKFLLFDRKKLKKWLLGENVSYIVNTFFHPWSNLISTIWENAERITFCHDPVLHEGVNGIMKLMYPLFIKKGDYIVVLTKGYIDIVEKKYGIDKGRIHYCPHGRMDLYKRKVSAQRPCEFPEYSKLRINFVFFGRIEKYKGLDVLGRAYKLVKEQYKNISLSIFGAGDIEPYRDFLREDDIRIINEYISDDQIGWIFQGDNIVLVLPYVTATQSGVIPIAFEFGIPIICSDLTGLKEQLDDGKAGLYCKAADEKDLAQKMECFLTNDKLYSLQRKMMMRLSDKIEWNRIIDGLMREIDA